MKIGLYHLISDVHKEEYVNSTLQGFLADIEEKLGEKLENINLSDFNQKDCFPLIFIKSGGADVEGIAVELELHANSQSTWRYARLQFCG